MSVRHATTEERLRVIIPRAIAWSAACLVGWLAGADTTVETSSAAAIGRTLEGYVWVLAVFVIGYCLGTRRWSAAILVGGAMLFGGASQLLAGHFGS